MNLYEETMEVMMRHGKTEHDVFFCECYQMGRNRNMPIQFPFSVFKDCSQFDYDKGGCTEEVNTSLKIVFNDGSWLERTSYDGAERWSFKISPVFESFVDWKKINLRMNY